MQPELSSDSSALTIRPHQVVEALFGAEFIELKGFGGVAAALPSWVPIEIVDIPQASSIDLARKSKTVWWGFAAVLGIAAAFMATLWLTVFLRSASQASLPAWSVRGVEPDGVAVAVGAQLIKIPVGGMLPSGEILRGFDVSRQMFTTDSQITVVKK